MALMMGGDAGISAFPDGDNIFQWTGTITGGGGTVRAAHWPQTWKAHTDATACPTIQDTYARQPCSGRLAPNYPSAVGQ